MRKHRVVSKWRIRRPEEKEENEKGGKEEGAVELDCVDSRPLCRRNVKGGSPMRPKETGVDGEGCQAPILISR
jgi:hypothetical protein